MQRQSKHLTVRELVLFAMLGSLMFCSKLLMEALPNVHLLGLLTAVFTIVYRKKALIPIYVYVFLVGIYAGFSYWWLYHLYVWAILWAVIMLLPQKMPSALAAVVYCVVCGLHGLLYGTMCAPVEALVRGFNFEQMLAYIGYGLYFDIIHCIGNVAVGILILPLSRLLFKLENKSK